MKFKDLLSGLPVVSCSGNEDDEIRGIAYSSKEVKPGWLFAALIGVKRDGFDFTEEALSKGAAAFLSERPKPPHLRGNWIHVQDAREALALCASNFYGHPSRKMKVIGVTGTNGKTSITYLVEEILKHAKCIPGVIGTISCRTPKMNVSSHLTTPEAPDLQRIMQEMVDQGVTHCAIEVSSHSLDLKRVWGIQFAVVVFTNLSGEHLDYHHSMDAYFEAKKKLFFLNQSKRIAVINIDDVWGQKLIPQIPVSSLTYGLQERATVRCRRYRLDESGIEMEVSYPGGEMEVRSPLLGRPNLYNILASIAISLALKISQVSIKDGLAKCAFIPGRFERIENSFGFHIYVDYAHTDDALRNLLQSFRELQPKRILLVFGAGGDRDRTKRERMGKVAADYADWVFLTSDNPRSEDPLAIIQEIEKGIKERGKKNYSIHPGRREALEHVLSLAQEGDFILVAGKGHEGYQIIKDKVIPFDDREVIRQILRKMETQRNG